MLKKYWFLVALALVVATGYLWPGPVGCVLDKDWVLTPAIFLILFLMSLSLPASGLASGFLRWRGLLPALAGTYVLLPVFAYMAAGLPLQQDLQVGLAVVAAVPTTLASGVIMTRLAGGNAALALAGTMVANLLNFLLAPLLLWLLLGAQIAMTAADVQEMILRLAQVVVLPIAGGQIARRWLAGWAGKHPALINVAGQILILSVVLTAVSGAARGGTEGPAGPSLPWLQGLVLVLIVAAMHLITGVLCYGMSAGLKAPEADRRAAAFAGAQKTLPLGLYLVGRYFTALPFAVLPILFYHATQLVLDAAIASRWGRREPKA